MRERSRSVGRVLRYSERNMILSSNSEYSTQRILIIVDWIYETVYNTFGNKFSKQIVFTIIAAVAATAAGLY